MENKIEEEKKEKEIENGMEESATSTNCPKLGTIMARIPLFVSVLWLALEHPHG